MAPSPEAVNNASSATFTLRKVRDMRLSRLTRLRSSPTRSYFRAGISWVHLYLASPVNTAMLRRSRTFSTFRLVFLSRKTIPHDSNKLIVATCSAKLSGWSMCGEIP